MKTNTIRIICPICNRGRLLDAANSTSAAKTRLYGPSHLDKAEWITKCPKCGSLIGISSTTEYNEMRRPGA